jgi:hypothetical protein
MRLIFIAALTLLLPQAQCAAASDGDDILFIGPVVKLVKVTVGKVVSVTGAETGEEKNGSVTVEDESGETKIFPIDATVKIVDGTLGALTLSDIKEGQKVKVEHFDRDDGKEKVQAVEVVK